MNGCNTFVQYIAIGIKYCKNATALSRHCPPRTMFLFSEVVTRRNYFCWVYLIGCFKFVCIQYISVYFWISCTECVECRLRTPVFVPNTLLIVMSLMWIKFIIAFSSKNALFSFRLLSRNHLRNKFKCKTL